MSRLSVAAAIVGLVVLGVAAPAWGHATLSSPSSVPANSEQRVTMDIPEERGEVRHTGIKIYLPPDWTGLGCDAAAPWRCTITPNALEGRTLVEWTNSSGAPVTETFTLTARTGAPGRYSMPVNQTYANGETVRWIGPEGSEEPAPFITVTAAAATTTTTASPPTTTPTTTTPTTAAPGATTTTTRPGATTTTSTPGATTTTSLVGETTTTAVDDTSTTTSTTEDTTTTTTPSDDEAEDADGGGGGSAVPILVALAVIALGAGGAMFFVLRRRAGGTTAPPPAP